MHHLSVAIMTLVATEQEEIPEELDLSNAPDVQTETQYAEAESTAGGQGLSASHDSSHSENEHENQSTMDPKQSKDQLEQKGNAQQGAFDASDAAHGR